MSGGKIVKVVRVTQGADGVPREQVVNTPWGWYISQGEAADYVATRNAKAAQGGSHVVYETRPVGGAELLTQEASE